MMQQEGGSNIETAEESRLIPKVAFTELTLGRVVGEGGFCRVSEISGVELDDVYDTSEVETNARKAFAEEATNHSLLQSGRFVLKTLRADLPEDEHIKGVVDLAIEADFLAELHHPNIIAMRATANSDPHESRYFVVLDRLDRTLDTKFNFWRKLVGENTGYWMPFFGYCCAKTNALHAVWKERMAAALDIAKALQYLHTLGIVYRDLKPDNIGFDRNGDLKIFDFGLAKRLDEVERTPDGRYLLTGNTGSLRYMAPEVARDEPYDSSVDVYSFGIIFWQICSLTTPYAGYSQKMHADKVVRQGQRPSPDPTWPMSWVELMQRCWFEAGRSRPNIDSVVETLQQKLAELEEDDGVLPTRANEIKAKKKKRQVSPENQRLDVDTRISTTSDKSVKRFDGDVV